MKFREAHPRVVPYGVLTGVDNVAVSLSSEIVSRSACEDSDISSASAAVSLPNVAVNKVISV